jgi:hypothetical protein
MAPLQRQTLGSIRSAMDSHTYTDWRDKPTVSQPLKKMNALYGTRSLFPCSQEPVTGPYPEPVESSPNPPRTTLSSIWILFSTALYVFLVDSFLLVFFQQDFLHFFFRSGKSQHIFRGNVKILKDPTCLSHVARESRIGQLCLNRR